MTTREIGYMGEEFAKNYLTRRRYSIISQNYTIRGGEIDIIAEKGNTLVFVEVKTRSSTETRGAEAVDEKKIAALVRTAQKFLFDNGESYRTHKIRFDCIEVYLSEDKKPKIVHIKNIDVT